MSILPAILNLKNTLETDSALKALVSSKKWRQLTVKTVYRDREEISMDQCPIIMITRPRVGRENGLNRKPRGRHTVRLYFGFYNPTDDRESAAQNAIQFEEAIEDAITADITRGGNASSTVPKDSVNDEGALHPVYFGVMEVELTKRT